MENRDTYNDNETATISLERYDKLKFCEAENKILKKQLEEAKNKDTSFNEVIFSVNKFNKHFNNKGIHLHTKRLESGEIEFLITNGML